MAILTSPESAPEPAVLQKQGIATPPSLLRVIARTFVTKKLALCGVVLVILIVGFSFIGPLVYHTNQTQTDLGAANLAPGGSHPLGTQNAGYDVLGQLMLGGQSSLEVGLATAVLSTVIGTIWGAIAGFVGGIADAVLMRIVDAMIAIPLLLLVLLMATIFAPSIASLILVLSLVCWLPTARLVRGETLTLRTREFVQAARGAGVRTWLIVLRHIVPNAAGTIIVQTTLQIANAILLLAALSYLGLGPPPPATNWGSMLTDGLNYIYDGYWWQIYPAGIAIVVTVVAFNFIGDALGDALEVRQRAR
jgi:peptide/nickel transport system permease protein